MSPEMMVVAGMVGLIAVLLAVVVPVAVSARRRRRRETREVWEAFAAETDLEVVDAGDSPRFEMRGEYDGEPMSFRIVLDTTHDRYRMRTTYAETPVDQAPSDLVVYRDDIGQRRRWETAGDRIDLEGPPFDGRLAARASDPLPGHRFLQSPEVREALGEVHGHSDCFVLDNGRLRLRENDFLDDPDRLRHCADLLAGARRTIRRASDESS